MVVDFEGLLGRMFEAMEECWCSPLFFESFGNVVPCVLFTGRVGFVLSS